MSGGPASLILAALLQAAPMQQAAPIVIEQPPFTISSEETPPEGFPYPTSYKITHLKWRSSDGLVTYDLMDNGGTISISYEVGVEPRRCVGSAQPFRFSAKPTELFNAQMLIGPGCVAVLTAAQAKALQREIGQLRKPFAAAHARFINRTIAQHGASRQRCREIGSGNHGLICVRYWDAPKLPR